MAETVVRWTTQWSDASLTINGEPMAVESVTYGEIVEKVQRDLKPVFYETSATFTVAASAIRDLLDALMPRYRGASDGTLARRVFYGGRKGRSALRRLYARGYLGVGMTAAGPVLLPDATPSGSKD